MTAAPRAGSKRTRPTLKRCVTVVSAALVVAQAFRPAIAGLKPRATHQYPLSRGAFRKRASGVTWRKTVSSVL